MADQDGDRVPDDIDCAPADNTVTHMAQRTCSSECAPGLEICTDGMWAECDAPTDCDCDPSGETLSRELPCGNCGTQLQACSPEGGWINQGECSEQGECSPGELANGDACGDRCGTQQRTCGETCQWNDWECTGEGACVPGSMESNERQCGACGGEQEQIRECLNTCEWSLWSNWGSCSDTGSCTPNQVETRRLNCGRCGTQLETRTCDANGCGFGDWTRVGGCTDQGPCTPGTRSQEMQEPWGACDGTERVTYTCTPECQWGNRRVISGSQRECLTSTARHCNRNKGVCECRSNSECTGEDRCVEFEPHLASGNYCGCAPGEPCWFLSHCDDLWRCAPGYCCDDDYAEDNGCRAGENSCN